MLPETRPPQPEAFGKGRRLYFLLEESHSQPWAMRGWNEVYRSESRVTLFNYHPPKSGVLTLEWPSAPPPGLSETQPARGGAKADRSSTSQAMLMPLTWDQALRTTGINNVQPTPDPSFQSCTLEFARVAVFPGTDEESRATACAHPCLPSWPCGFRPSRNHPSPNGPALIQLSNTHSSCSLRFLLGATEENMVETLIFQTWLAIRCFP